MEFLNQNVFYMILIPLVLLVVLILTNKESIEQHFSKDMRKVLSVGDKSIDKTTRNGLMFIALIFFIIALARPVMDMKEQNLKQKLIPIVIAVDLSKSMFANDIYPNRISLAKQKLKSIISKAKNATIGVVLFAKDSYILSPVTEDFLSLNYIVDNLDVNTDVSNGSNIAAVLEATSHMLSDYKVKNLIVLSDGGNANGYSDELDFAKDNNIAIYSIGIATKKGSPIPNKKGGYITDRKGNIVTVKLNESIKNLSLESSGGYIDYTLDETDVEAIVNRINAQSKKEELSVQKIKTYTELFYYPLGAGIFFLLLSFSSLPRKSVNGVVVLLALFSLQDCYGFEFEHIEKAKEYYSNKQYKESSDEYRKISGTPQSYYNLANSLYKEGKYDEALKTYSKVVTDDKELEYKKLHNIGNSYVRSNDLQKAKEFYEKALKLKDDKQTKENLELVNKELEKQKEQKNKDSNDKNKEQNNKKDQQQNQEKKNKQQNQNQEQNKKDKDSKENKNEDEKDKKNKESSKKDEKKKNQEQNKKDISDQNSSKNMKKQPISDMEEQKWMKMLQNRKTPVYLQRLETKKGNSDESQPW